METRPSGQLRAERSGALSAAEQARPTSRREHSVGGKLIPNPRSSNDEEPRDRSRTHPLIRMHH